MSWNYTKMMFITMMVLSTLFTISSNNWIGMWMGMEMNLMSFIPFISEMKNKKSSKAIMMYFLVQSIGSMILMFSILMNSFIMISPIMMEEIVKMFLMMGLLIKLGVAPFHMWLPEVMSNMKWMDMMLLMTWQKLAPMYTLSNLINNNKMMLIMIMMSTLIGAIGGINITSLRKIMAYSSINHLGWMLIMMINKTQWWMYLMIYSLMVMLICLLFHVNNFFFMNQVNNNQASMFEKYTIASILLSMGGLPPFIGFMPKWMAIQSMINSKMMIPLIVMVMMSLLTLFYYMRMMSSMMMMYSTINKWIISTKTKINMIMIINLCLPLVCILSFM